MCDTATDSRNLCLKMIHLLINFYILSKSNPPPPLAMLPVRVQVFSPLLTLHINSTCNSYCYY